MIWMRNRNLHTVIAALMIALLLFGCSTVIQPDGKAGKPEKDNTQPSLENEKKSAAFDESMSLIKRGNTAEARVEYEISDSDMPNGVESSNASIVIYTKGADKIRTDMMSKNIELRSYLISNDAYVCISQRSKWVCYRQKSGTVEAIKAFENDVENNPGEYKVTYEGTEVMLGAKTKCYKFQDLTYLSESKTCRTMEGIPLYISIVAPSSGSYRTLKLVAKQYNLRVSDSDFELPALPQELPKK